MCQMMDPTNPNIALLQGKLNEWDEMIKKGKKAEIKGVIISYIVLALLFGFLALMIFLHNLII